MELTHRDRVSDFFISLRQRAQKVSENSQAFFKPYRAFRRPILGLGLFLFAIFSAIHANQIAQKEALLDWQHHHFPSVLAWKTLLEPHGYKTQSNPKLLHKVIKSLPMTTDLNHTVWVDESLQWVALFDKEPVIFSRISALEPNASTPIKWKLLGSGWSAIEAIDEIVFSRLKPIQKTLQTHAKKTKLKAYQDPRQIRF